MFLIIVEGLYFLQLENGVWKIGSRENRNAETLCHGEWTFTEAWHWQDKWINMDYVEFNRCALATDKLECLFLIVKCMF